jgi:hypothetical protein
MNNMASKNDHSAFIDLHVYLPAELHYRMSEAKLRLLREGIRVSYASLIEVGLEELLRNRDLASILRKHGASARRR